MMSCFGSTWKKMLITLALLTAASAPVRAFYWDSWPGNGAEPTATGGNQDDPTVTAFGDPSADPDTVTDLAKGGHAPEPASLVSGLLGLGALGLWRCRRK